MIRLAKAFAPMLALALWVAPALGASVEDQVVAQLQSQGYQDISVNRTLLGRIRIVAVTETEWREIVIDPRTGEILRDFRRIDTRAGAEAQVVIAPGGTTSPGTTPTGTKTDSNDDDDGGNDDSGDDRDNSGSDDRDDGGDDK